MKKGNKNFIPVNTSKIVVYKKKFNKRKYNNTPNKHFNENGNDNEIIMNIK